MSHALKITHLLRTAFVHTALSLSVLAASTGISVAAQKFSPKQSETSDLQASPYGLASVINEVRPAVSTLRAVWDKEQYTSSGSAFTLTTDGFILTSAHNIVPGEQLAAKLKATGVQGQLPDKIEIIFKNGKSYVANIFAIDRKRDLALLKITDTQNFPYVTFGNSISVQQTVFTVGSPFELSDSVSVGLLSGINVDPYDSLAVIQIDAVINHGNSGGPLFAADGKVIGLIRSRETRPYPDRVGFGYAIHLDVIKSFIEEVKPEILEDTVLLPQASNFKLSQQEEMPKILEHAKSSIAMISTGNLKGIGLIVREDGLIVTAASLLESNKKSQTLDVQLDGEDYKISARVIGIDNETGLALIKVDLNKTLPVVKLGQSILWMGEKIFALSDFSDKLIITHGVISGAKIDGMAYTDAEVSNLGTPLFNSAGEVVGIAVNTFSDSEWVGLSQVAPAHSFNFVVKSLLAHRWTQQKVSDVPSVATVRQPKKIEAPVCVGSNHVESLIASVSTSIVSITNPLDTDESMSEDESSFVGAIISPDGYLLTNTIAWDDKDPSHAKSIKVRLSNSQELSATLVGVSSRANLSVYKIDSQMKFIPIKLEDDQNVLSGQPIVLFGTAENHMLVSAQIVATPRRILEVSDQQDRMIQATANFGADNGAMWVDFCGNLIGVGDPTEINLSNIFAKIRKWGLMPTRLGIAFATPASTIATEIRKIFEEKEMPAPTIMGQPSKPRAMLSQIMRQVSPGQ